VTPPAPGRIGPYRVLAELGRGGMGVVLLVEHVETGARYALKRLDALAGRDGPERARLEREAEALGRLDHPGVVRVHSADFAGPTSYVVLGHLAGGSLADRLRGGPLAVAEARRVVRDVADALAYLHDQGVVHRDLKPANVLFDEAGRACLADFGLARLAGPDHLTRTGELLGTPGFMAPEQVEDAKRVDTRTDVWAFGALLYAALAGRRPYADRAGVAAALAAARRELPAPLESLRPDAPRELVAVCRRAMAFDPDERYADGQALVSALGRGDRAGEVGGGAGPRLRHLAAAAAGLGALAVGLALALAAGRGQPRPTPAPEPPATAGSPSAGPASPAAPPAPEPTVTPGAAGTELVRLDPVVLGEGEAAAAFVDGLAYACSDRGRVLRGWEGDWTPLEDLSDRLGRLRPDPKASEPVLWRRLPGRSWLFAVRHVTGSHRVWDDRALGREPLDGEVAAAVAVADHRVAVVRADGSIALWDLERPGPLLEAPAAERSPWAAAFGPDGVTLYVVAGHEPPSPSDGGFHEPGTSLVHAFDVDWEQGALARRFRARVAFAYVVTTARGRLAIGCLMGLVDELDPATGARLPLEPPFKTDPDEPTVRSHPGRVRGLAYGPDGRLLYSVATTTGASELAVWRTSDRHLVAHVPLGKPSVRGVAVSRDGRRVLAGSDEGVVYPLEWR